MVITVHASIIPLGRMLITKDDYLIPIDDKLFRITLLTLGFMYGGDVKCAGMIKML